MQKKQNISLIFKIEKFYFDYLCWFLNYIVSLELLLNDIISAYLTRCQI